MAGARTVAALLLAITTLVGACSTQQASPPPVPAADAGAVPFAEVRPGTLVVTTESGPEIAIDAVRTDAPRRPIARLTATPPDGWQRDDRPLLVSEGGLVAIPIVRRGGEVDRPGDTATLVGDLLVPGVAPRSIDGAVLTFLANDALIVRSGTGDQILDRRGGDPMPITLDAESYLAAGPDDTPLATADGEALVIVRRTSSHENEYRAVRADGSILPLGQTLPATRLVTGADRMTGAAGEIAARSCDGDPAMTVCGVAVVLASGDTRWRVKVDPGIGQGGFAWSIEGDRIVVVARGPAVVVGRQGGIQRLGELPPGSTARIVGMTRTHVILAASSGGTEHLVAVPFGGGNPVDLGTGTLIRVVQPAAG